MATTEIDTTEKKLFFHALDAILKDLHIEINEQSPRAL
jgi:hypothetical protein